MIKTYRAVMVPVAVLAAAGLTLAACSPAAEKDSTEAVATPGNEALAVALKGNPDLSVFSDLMVSSGLETALEGVGPYTVFAPNNTALGAEADALKSDGMEAQAAALVRMHIVPGSLSRADIEAALDASGSGPVQMRTMGGDMLTFSRDGGAIVLTAGDDSQARLAGEETLAANGVLQPVDAVLVKPAAAE